MLNMGIEVNPSTVNEFYGCMSSQVVEEQSRALQLDALRSSHPVEVPIRHAKADAEHGLAHGRYGSRWQ